MPRPHSTTSTPFITSSLVIPTHPWPPLQEEEKEGTQQVEAKNQEKEGPLRSADNEKELWDSRMHQTGKETGGEEMPKVLGLQRLKRGKTQMGNPPAGGAFTYQGGYIPQAFTNNSVLSYNGPIHPTVTPLSSYPFYAHPMYAPPNMPAYPNPADGKGDLDNFLHLFEGAIRMQKWLMPVACHMFTCTLKDFARIWWNSQKIGSILNYKDLKAMFQSHFSQQKKFPKTHLAVHNIKQREGESTRAFITRYTDDILQIIGLHKEQRISGSVHGLRTRSLVEHLSTDLPSTYKGMMEKTCTWVEAREVATNGILNNQRDDPERSKKFSWGNNIGPNDRGRLSPYKGKITNYSPIWTIYCHFLKDYRHETNQCRELRHQIEEAVKSGQLAHWIGEIAFPSLPNVGSADPVIIKAYISGRQVNRVYLDGGSSYEVIYKHCFLKLKLSIRSLRVDSNTPLIGFLGEQSWPLREIPLEITIGEGPITCPQYMEPQNSTRPGVLVPSSQKPKEEEGGSTNRYQGKEEIVLKVGYDSSFPPSNLIDSTFSGGGDDEGSVVVNLVMPALADGDRGKQTYQSQMPLYSQLEGTGSSVGTAEGLAEAWCSSSSSSSSSFLTSSSSLSSSDDSLS
ncbi:reverse transcriptase domain-containing protein [Tanacetum coccineum]|uniref:Reverse transcriptase domain-containing protein n=1 Tax=Tanacetum coccineum TaxID=301880 RepID=A0ABQ4Z9G2_9ASTR